MYAGGGLARVSLDALWSFLSLGIFYLVFFLFLNHKVFYVQIPSNPYISLYGTLEFWVSEMIFFVVCMVCGLIIIVISLLGLFSHNCLKSVSNQNSKTSTYDYSKYLQDYLINQCKDGLCGMITISKLKWVIRCSPAKL